MRVARNRLLDRIFTRIESRPTELCFDLATIRRINLLRGATNVRFRVVSRGPTERPEIVNNLICRWRPTVSELRRESGPYNGINAVGARPLRQLNDVRWFIRTARPGSDVRGIATFSQAKGFLRAKNVGCVHHRPK